MEWHYDLCGAEPIIRDVPVYDASTTASFTLGELVMLSATDPDSNAGHGVAFITAYSNGSAVEAVDALGILNETYANASTLPGDGEILAKAIINPFAVYFAEYDQATAVAVTSSSTTTLTIATLEDDIDTGYVYLVTGSPSGNTGSLRYLTASADGSATMYAALPNTDTGSTIIKILPRYHALTALDSTSTKLEMQLAAGSDISLRVIENYITSAGNPREPLTYAKHKNLDGLSSAKFFADIVMIDHLFNPNA